MIVPAAFPKKKEYASLFCTLNLIFCKTRLARFLSPVEISDLEQNVINLSTIIFLKFKNKSITIKMHDVLVHMVKFVRKYKTIGLFNEQAIESLHQIMNVDEKKYYHLNKQPLAKTKCIMDQQNIREDIKNNTECAPISIIKILLLYWIVLELGLFLYISFCGPYICLAACLQCHQVSTSLGPIYELTSYRFGLGELEF